MANSSKAFYICVAISSRSVYNPASLLTVSLEIRFDTTGCLTSSWPLSEWTLGISKFDIPDSS